MFVFCLYVNFFVQMFVPESHVHTFEKLLDVSGVSLEVKQNNDNGNTIHGISMNRVPFLIGCVTKDGV